jgi:glycosyltransferase involved in cell wall biosynthesis
MNAWVVFHGAGARTLDALADYDAFVVLGQDQGSPNALLEALAAGLPCIANDDGGTREQIQHEHTGLLVADRSSSTLAAAITSVLVDRGLAARIGAAGRAHVLGSFNLERMVSRYAQLFESFGASAATREKTA